MSVPFAFQIRLVAVRVSLPEAATWAPTNQRNNQNLAQALIGVAFTDLLPPSMKKVPQATVRKWWRSMNAFNEALEENKTDG